ncbi:Annexin A13, partial [Gonapodya sp. JEL0774]
MSQISPASVQDAEALHKAFKGLGMDEKVLIEILSRRSVTQILEINQAYRANFGKSLQEKIESEAGKGDFGGLAKALSLHPAEYDAHLLHKATKGLGTDEDLLIEVLMGRSNVEITAIKAAYKNLYNKDLEQVVASEVSGDLKKFFVIMLQGQRDEEGTMRS